MQSTPLLMEDLTLKVKVLRLKVVRFLARKDVSVMYQGCNGESRMTRGKLNFFVDLGLLSLPVWVANPKFCGGALNPPIERNVCRFS